MSLVPWAEERQSRGSFGSTVMLQVRCPSGAPGMDPRFLCLPEAVPRLSTSPQTPEAPYFASCNVPTANFTA